MKIAYKTRFIIGTIDTSLVVLSIFIVILIKPVFSSQQGNDSHLLSLTVFLIIWILVSHFSNKFRLGSHDSLGKILLSVFISNFIVLAIVSVLIVSLFYFQYSRTIIFGTILFASVFELLLGILYHAVIQSTFLQEWIGPEYINGNGNGKNGKYHFYHNGINYVDLGTESSFPEITKNYNNLQHSIAEEAGKEAAQWITSLDNITDPKTLLIATETRFNIDNQPNDFYTTIVNLSRINDIQRINKFFESVNNKLPMGGIFIGCGETYMLRKQRILNKYPPILNYIIYTIDFLVKRVAPKIKLTRKFYFLFSRGKNRVMSKTETVGRLYSCGFEVIEEKSIDHLLFWKAKKIKQPAFDYDPTYGFLIRLKRIGKNGKVFNVYKFRTMHAYSEYVQGYIYDNNNLDDSGKFKDDYRITTVGKILRKFWLDELPMLINVLKGQMKLVGVRPLSAHFFNLYSSELQQMRVKFKPGLIPPYYAQHPTPKSLEEVQANEIQYLVEYIHQPFRTDLKYFFKAMHNILIKKARSK